MIERRKFKEKEFKYKFIDESPDCRMSCEISEDYFNRKIETGLDKVTGEAFLYANKEAFLYLAKIFIKIGLGSYPVGYHQHFRKSLGSDEGDEIFQIGLID